MGSTKLLVLHTITETIATEGRETESRAVDHEHEEGLRNDKGQGKMYAESVLRP